jgi:hypothetical protein
LPQPEPVELSSSESEDFCYGWGWLWESAVFGSWVRMKSARALRSPGPTHSFKKRVMDIIMRHGLSVFFSTREENRIARPRKSVFLANVPAMVVGTNRLWERFSVDLHEDSASCISLQLAFFLFPKLC